MSEKKRVLITGVSGLLGSNLAYYFKDRYEVFGVFHHHPLAMPGIQARGADITNRDEIRALMNEMAPDVVIHCAAMANPDTCEQDPELAESLNVGGVRNVVEGISKSSTKLIYISTDAVFDGNQGNYRETDGPCPPHVYGRTKLRGEQVAAGNAQALIARINIFGWDAGTRRSLGEWVINELSAGRKITGFTDVIFSSIYTMRLAELFDLAMQKDLSGVYHFASRTSLSKFEFAVRVARIFGLDPSMVEPGSVDDFKFKAARAKDLSLNTDKLQGVLGKDIPTLPDSIEAFYDGYRGGLPREIRRAAGIPAGANQLHSKGTA